MTTIPEFLPVPVDGERWRVDPLRLAVAGYLARYRGETRRHAESDLRVYLTWCQERGLDPLAARRPHIELYVRWMQETRRYAASTVSRRMSVVGGFYRTCVIDEILEHSPADYVRRPNVPPESPTLGLTHLQLEALLTAARTSDNPCDFALVCLLGLLGLRIFEACAANIEELGEEHGHRVLRVVGKGHKVVLVPLPPAVARAVDRARAGRIDGPLLLNTQGRRLDRHAATPPPGACTTSPTTQASEWRACTRTCSATRTSPRCSTPAWTCATSRSRPATPTPARPCATTAPAPPSTDTPTTSSPPTWPREPEPDLGEAARHVAGESVKR